MYIATTEDNTKETLFLQKGSSPAIEISVTMPTESTLTLVGREELKERIAKVKQVLENVENSLQFTNIPVYVLTNYIKEETNIDITKS